MSYLPNELYIAIVDALISDDYAHFLWSARVRDTLLSLALVNRELRNIVDPYLSERVLVSSLHHIQALLSWPHSRMQNVQSLMLLPGPIHRDTCEVLLWKHEYCTTDLYPLFVRLAPYLTRLVIVHKAGVASCSHFPEATSPLVSLRELVVLSPHLLFPHVAVSDDMTIPSWPRLESLVRLASLSENIWWRDLRYTSAFPRLGHLVFVQPHMMDTDWRSHVEALVDQMNENEGLRVLIVDSDRYRHYRADWQEFFPILPLGRFLFDLVDLAPWYLPFFLRRAFQGTLFKGGEPYTTLPQDFNGH